MMSGLHPEVEGKVSKGCKRCGPKSSVIYREHDQAWVCMQCGFRLYVTKILNKIERDLKDRGYRR